MLPSHSQTSKWVQRGLFNAVTHFAQLEARIAELASAEEQLAAFSVFAEACLAVRTLPQATDIWPEGLIPAEARRRYTLPERIVGADGVFRTISGDIHPYQVVFRPPVRTQEGGTPQAVRPAVDGHHWIERPALSSKDLAPFLALLERVSQPLLFTNCTTLPTSLANRSGFHSLRGNDLDRLGGRTFNAIRRWLQGGGMVPERVSLPSHQARAVSGLQPLLEAGERAVGWSAPGIGVDILALKLAEGAGSGSTMLIVLPSLAHIRTMLWLWRCHTVWSDLACLWVCADAVVGHDAPVVRPADLDVPLVSDMEAVRRFLTWRCHGVRVLFSTYGSVRIIARALVGAAPLDMGLFMESQETASDPFALDDANLPIRKRLFFGAATRHYHLPGKPVGMREQEPGGRLAWSLEDPHRYGPIVPIAPLATAVANGMLRPWKLLITVIPTADTVATTTVAARTMACGAALDLVLAHSMGRSVRHIHTYHGTIQEASAFVALPAAAGTAGAESGHTAGVAAVEPVAMGPLVVWAGSPRLHLDGTASTADRELLLHRFARAERAVLSNVRCLAEGLPLLLADLVVFCASPRKAKLDVAQAMAAVLAKDVVPVPRPSYGSVVQETNCRAPEMSGRSAVGVATATGGGSGVPVGQYDRNTGTGLLCVPLRLSAPFSGESDADLIGRSLDTAEVLWEVLQFLRELDDSLEEQIGLVGAYRGRTGAWPSGMLPPDAVGLGERLEFILPVPLPAAWAELLWNGCLERLVSGWDWRFGQWQRADGETIPGVTEWVEQQRRAFGKGALAPERIRRLEQHGFVWDPKQTEWDAHFAAFERYRQQLGDPSSFNLLGMAVAKQHTDPHRLPDDPRLAEWVRQQRREYMKGRLSPEAVARLERVGFVWDPDAVAWEAIFAVLQAWQRQQTATSAPSAVPRCLVPDIWPDNPALAEWAKQQRLAFARNKLAPERYRRLHALGFVWDLDAASWEEQFVAFLQFKLEQGHGVVPDLWPTAPSLVTWAREQRKAQAKGDLAADRLARLDALGFCWDLDAARWEEQFASFLQFKQQQGHGKIPEVWPDNLLLAAWAREQRKEQLRGRLAAERLARLTEEGFCWDLEAAYWDEMAVALQQFQQQHGHCLVPPSWPGNPHLADWVGKQRRDFVAGRLEEKRVASLQAMDFVWDPEEKEWTDQYAVLVAWHGATGHCHVPDHETVLADWVRRQRRAGVVQEGRHALSAARRQRLDELGFIWEARTAEWEAMFLVLQEFCQERHHCIVPAKWPENSRYKAGGPRLVQWVATLRRDYGNGTLTAEQVQRLNALGFIWDAKAIFWEELFAALVEFRDQYGNCLVPETYQEHGQLAWWVAAQRKAYKAGQLEPERIARLDALGFFWDPLEAQWYEMFQELLRYREQFGNCLVPRDWTGNPKLAVWANTQRQARLHGHLSPVRVERLDALGFVWDQKEVVLEEMLAGLQSFKHDHGHCQVPVQWPRNPALGLWVQFQRQEYQKGRLDPNRIQRLAALGFSWELK